MLSFIKSVFESSSHRTARLTEAIASAGTPECADALREIAKLGPKARALVGPISELLKPASRSFDVPTAFGSLSALSAIGPDAEAVLPLVEALLDTSFPTGLRSAALRTVGALAVYPHPAAARTCEFLLTNELELRVAACEALAAMRYDEPGPMRGAILALQWWGPDLQRQLLTFFSNSSPDELQSARLALVSRPWFVAPAHAIVCALTCPGHGLELATNILLEALAAEPRHSYRNWNMTWLDHSSALRRYQLPAFEELMRRWPAGSLATNENGVASASQHTAEWNRVVPADATISLESIRLNCEVLAAITGSVMSFRDARTLPLTMSTLFLASSRSNGTALWRVSPMIAQELKIRSAYLIEMLRCGHKHCSEMIRAFQCMQDSSSFAELLAQQACGVDWVLRPAVILAWAQAAKPQMIPQAIKPVHDYVLSQLKNDAVSNPGNEWDWVGKRDTMRYLALLGSLARDSVPILDKIVENRGNSIAYRKEAIQARKRILGVTA